MFGSNLTSKENIELFVKNNFPNVKDFEFISIDEEWFEFDSEGYLITIIKTSNNGDAYKGKLISYDGIARADTKYNHSSLVNCLIETKELLNYMSQNYPQEC